MTWIDKACAPSRLARKYAPAATRRIYWVLAIVLIVWDVFLAQTATPDDTWSEQMRIGAHKYLFFPWFLGALTGHLFHANRDARPILRDDIAYTIMWIVSGLLFVLGLFGVFERMLASNDQAKAGVICVTATAGILAGLFLWPMNRQERLLGLRLSPPSGKSICGIILFVLFVVFVVGVTAADSGFWNSLRDKILQAISLSPDQTRTIGTILFVMFVAIDVVTTADEIPGNSIREWIIRLSFWRSQGLWPVEKREAARRRSRFNLFNYLPATGAFVPYMTSVLIGHFFHPWLVSPTGICGFTGLFTVLAIGCALSVITYFVPQCQRNDIPVFPISVFGVLSGALLWPVSACSV